MLMCGVPSWLASTYSVSSAVRGVSFTAGFTAPPFHFWRIDSPPMVRQYFLYPQAATAVTRTTTSRATVAFSWIRHAQHADIIMPSFQSLSHHHETKATVNPRVISREWNDL